MLWIILILVLFLPTAVLLYYGKDVKKNSEEQKEYYQFSYSLASSNFYYLRDSNIN